MRGISWLAEKLLASQEGLCSIELVKCEPLVSMCRRGVCWRGMDTILFFAGSHQFCFYHKLYWMHPFVLCWKCQRACTVSEGWRQVRHIWLHRGVSQVLCDGAASNWAINICVIVSVYSLQHLELAQSSICRRSATNCGWLKTLDRRLYCGRGRSAVTLLAVTLWKHWSVTLRRMKGAIYKYSVTVWHHWSVLLCKFLDVDFQCCVTSTLKILFQVKDA
jgi:hypothetical protein